MFCSSTYCPFLLFSLIYHISAVTLNSTSATRLYFDTDIPETQQFLTRLGGVDGSLPAVTTASSSITKCETVTINKMHQFLQGKPHVRGLAHLIFYCIATVTDILGEYGWHYISCTKAGCNTKLGKTETSLYCVACKKVNNVGLIRYRFEISVRDKNDEVATFVFSTPTVETLPGQMLEISWKTRSRSSATRQTFTVSRIVRDTDAAGEEAAPAESGVILIAPEIPAEHESPAVGETSLPDPKRGVADLEEATEEDSGDRQKEKRQLLQV
ncbi:unnamed protein product [Microthlaspi erraticum]|uniref:Replication factor A C-terminal domain-containing protein n=1 Tax=Microthlaspi erraticum TaxID=1685480 RepID=A0A6D2IDV4_9BRAS|nr:unnamed protein product [Microthlaspi erraticum]